MYVYIYISMWVPGRYNTGLDIYVVICIVFNVYTRVQ